MFSLIVVKMLLGVFIWKSNRKTGWAGSSHMGSGLRLTSGPPGHFQMMHVPLSRTQTCHVKQQMLLLPGTDSHRTSQWGMSYAEYLHASRFLPLHSPCHPASHLSLNKWDLCNFETGWVVKNKWNCTMCQQCFLLFLGGRYQALHNVAGINNPCILLYSISATSLAKSHMKRSECDGLCWVCPEFSIFGWK